MPPLPPAATVWAKTPSGKSKGVTWTSWETDREAAPVVAVPLKTAVLWTT